MRDSVATFLTEQNITGTVYCAVSGGADSIALLHCLWALREQHHLTLCAVHFHHHLRGEAADRDAQFVAAFCDAYGIPLQTGHADTATYAKARGQSVEQAARTLRYAFFEALPPGWIATAHTADDNLETALIHLIRGASLRGLCGIPPARGRFIRPMLAVTRQEVLTYLTAHGIDHVEDESNQTDAYLRNRLRHHVIPQLLSENPALLHSYAAASERMRQEDAFLDHLARDALERARQGAAIQCSTLLAEPPVLQARAILLWLRQLRLSNPSASHVQALVQLLKNSNPSAQVILPGNLIISRQYDCLVQLPPTGPEITPTSLKVPGITPIPALGVQVLCSFTPSDDAIALRVTGPLFLRSRQTGDTLRLPGGRKSLKKWMIDRKIPAALRSRIPVIADSQGIAAVIGIGTDLDHIPTSRDSVLYLSILEKEEI